MSLNHELHMMVDLETLGTSPSSIILSIGAVTFVPASDFSYEDSIYRELNIRDQNRTIDTDTIKFWMAQETKPPMDGICSLEEALADLTLFIETLRPKHFWANGTDFDFSLLKNAYDQAGMSIPWGYNDIKDYRTMRKLFRHVPIFEQNPDAHNALSDAKYQAMHLSAILVNLDKMVKGYEDDGK